MSVDADSLHLYRGDGKELRIVADDGLALLSFDKEIEKLDHRLRTGIRGDDIHRTQERIISRSDVILEGTDKEIILGFSHAHHVDIERIEVGQRTVGISLQPVRSYDTDHIGVVLDHFEHIEIRTLLGSVDRSCQRSAIAKAVAHIAHGAGTGMVKDDAEVSCAGMVFELFPLRYLSLHDLLHLVDRDERILVGLVDDQGNGIRSDKCLFGS